MNQSFDPLNQKRKGKETNYECTIRNNRVEQEKREEREQRLNTKRLQSRKGVRYE